MDDALHRDELVGAALKARDNAYAPYSKFRVGAALRFADGAVVTGANVENASYGLSLCAETAAVANAMSQGYRGGLEEIAVIGSGSDPVTPCGRCRQVLYELASLGNTDPVIWCASETEIARRKLSDLLPDAFGPGHFI